ncbi:MAG: SET domain-containing protein-lysine N-methyltransferase [Nitrospirales bacterium]|nr:SET domain-containing protein-lysine N-methyltransferase [Nitrospira sp.]MDR4499980.1 SET domain-containing protein-lysine N-methyltransferase [Nitrospirales bacterium]
MNTNVQPSPINGKGLFAAEPIRARQKIGEFEGEVISQRVARRRAKTRRHIAIVEVNNGKAIDAAGQKHGFRFINHSCSPNTYMRIIRERVEFYSLRHIKVGEELTCHYGESHHEGLRRCTCQSANCRLFL